MKKSVKINLGSGSYPLKNYINVDIDAENNPDIICDLNDFPYPFKDNYADEILLYHVLEHLDNPLNVIFECHRILKPGGVLRIRVPHVNADLGKNPYHKNYFREEWFYTFDPKRREWQQGEFLNDRKAFDVKLKTRRIINPLWGIPGTKAELVVNMVKVLDNFYQPPLIDKLSDKLYDLFKRRWTGRYSIKK